MWPMCDDLGSQVSAVGALADPARQALHRYVYRYAVSRLEPVSCVEEVGEVAHSLAALDDSPLADGPDLLEQAAAEVTERAPDADADDVLLCAAAQQSVVERRGA
jgi:hypothetical protein